MITVVDYGVGNIGSVANMLERLTVDYQVSADPNVITQTNALLLPGVGAAGVGMKNLVERKLDVAIVQAAAKGMPFLGFCLGMQLLFEYSEEADTPCLGIFKGSVKKFRKERRIPQIGWNEVTVTSSNRYAQKLFEGVPPNSPFYFVNSYYPLPTDESQVAATSKYGEQFASVVATNTIVATQFHPEKSGDIGLQLIKNFVKGYL